MLRIRTTRWAALVAVLALAACGGGDARADAAAPAESGAAGGASSDAPAGSAVPGATAGAGSAGRVDVTISKAPFAGTHQMSGDMMCNMFNGMWQATLEQDRAAGLSGMLVMLKGVPATGGSTDQVTLNLVFGHGTEMSTDAGVIDVHGSETGGDGRGSVTREGESAVLRVEGTTFTGARVEAVVRCGAVDFLQ